MMIFGHEYNAYSIHRLFCFTDWLLCLIFFLGINCFQFHMMFKIQKGFAFNLKTRFSEFSWPDGSTATSSCKSFHSQRIFLISKIFYIWEKALFAEKAFIADNLDVSSVNMIIQVQLIVVACIIIICPNYIIEHFQERKYDISFRYLFFYEGSHRNS